MNPRRLAPLVIVFLALAAAPLSATLFVFDPTTATFTRTGDFAWTSSNPGASDHYVSFNDPAYSSLAGASFSLVNPGDTSPVIQLGSLTLNAGSIDCVTPGTTNYECDARSFTVSMTIQGMPSFVITISSPQGTSGQIEYTTGATTDGGVDVALNYTGVSEDQSFGSTGILRAQIVNSLGGDWIEWTNQNQSQGIYALFTLIEADQEAVPEPATYVLIGSALAALAFLRRRRTA